MEKFVGFLLICFIIFATMGLVKSVVDPNCYANNANCVHR